MVLSRNTAATTTKTHHDSNLIFYTEFLTRNDALHLMCCVLWQWCAIESLLCASSEVYLCYSIIDWLCIHHNKHCIIFTNKYWFFCADTRAVNASIEIYTHFPMPNREPHTAQPIRKQRQMNMKYLPKYEYADVDIGWFDLSVFSL